MKTIFFIFTLLLLSITVLHGEENSSPAFFCKKLEMKDSFKNDPSTHGLFCLIAENFPPNKKYTLHWNNLNHKPQKYGICFLNDEGVMALHTFHNKRTIELSNNHIYLGNYLPGEPTFYTLIPQDKHDKNTYQVTIIPNPHVVKDQKGRKIAMRILTPDLERFAFKLTNFQPNEKILTISNSEGETIAHQEIIGESGGMTCTVFPAVIGKKRGKADFKVILETGETMGLRYDWGYPKK